LHVWKSLPEEAKYARQESVGKRWNKSNRERNALSARDPARSSTIIVRVLQQSSASFKKAPTGRGQFNFMTVSFEQLNPDIFF